MKNNDEYYIGLVKEIKSKRRQMYKNRKKHPYLLRDIVNIYSRIYTRKVDPIVF